MRKFQNEKQVSCYQYAYRRNHRVVVMLLSPAMAIVPIVIVAGLLNDVLENEPGESAVFAH